MQVEKIHFTIMLDLGARCSVLGARCSVLKNLSLFSIVVKCILNYFQVKSGHLISNIEDRITRTELRVPSSEHRASSIKYQEKEMLEQSHKEALWWEPTDNSKIRCTLCPRYCKIGPDQSGFCYIRKNQNGKLVSSGYGHPTGFAVDPIEKKPLSHFLPGSTILSFGTAGCNLGCRFCQNWSISKAKLDDLHALSVSPEEVVKLAQKHQTPSIAYTYNDPTIFGEYVIDISKLARQEGYPVGDGYCWLYRQKCPKRCI